MKPTISLSYSQQLSLTPQLQQAIRLLQLSSQALELEIQTMLDKNPFLESDAAQTQDLSGPESDLSELEFVSRSKNNTIEFNEYQEWLTNRATETTLQEHLRWQLFMGNFSENQKLVGLLLIDSINEEGYLEVSLEDIALDFIQHYPEQEVTSLVEIEQVLEKIQGFDPIGVGSRSLTECLRIQLLAKEKQAGVTLALRALQHLDVLAKRDYARLKRELNLTEAELKQVLALLKTLTPKPGNSFVLNERTHNERSHYVIPDLIVKKKNARFSAELNVNALPKLRLNAEYVAIMNRKATPRSQTILKEHYQEARQFLSNLKHRQEILLLVANYIVDYQQDFFEYGDAKLKPMILQNIATACHLHESTISRITTQKFLECPKGLFELKYLFSSQACENQSHDQSHGSAISTKAIQAAVKKLIDQEPSENPFTDDTIMKRLWVEGMKISRRAVTKYREKMKIPSSRQRKSLTLFQALDMRRNYNDDAHPNYRKKSKPNPHVEK